MNKQPEYVFIVNPAAGACNSEEVIERIHATCRKRDLKYRILETKCPKDASEIARKLPKSGKIIFAVGGDGTLNEVLQGVARTKNVLGVIPNGTCNDFYYALSKIKTKDKTLKIDLGTVNYRHYFIDFVGIGFDTEVTIAIHKFRKKWVPVSQRLTLAIVSTLATFKPLDVKFKIGGDTKRGKFVVVVAANGPRFGGGYYIAPEANLQDGLMDICFIDEMSKLKLVKVISAAKTGSHVKSPYVHIRRTDHIKIHSEKPFALNFDGEIYSANSYDIRIHKQAIAVFNDRKFIQEIAGYEG
jgi:YegS/Rv2252/BmrU family lipid kinase